MPYDLARRLWGGTRVLKNHVANLLDSPVVVLVYHRVTTLPSDPQLLAVSPDNFRDHLHYLKDHFPIVRFDADWSTVQEPSLAITFDDGYADNALAALPILEELEVPATFFISTGTIGSRIEFWWDELERVVLNGTDYPDRFTLEDPEYGKQWATATGEQRQLLYDEIHSRLFWKIGAERRERWLEQLRSWARAERIGREAYRPLAESEVKTLAASPWTTIGAHTVFHPPLAALSKEEQRQEIISSKHELEQILQTEVSVFSYPFGTRLHYNRTTVGLCREAGFLKAASNFPGQAHRWTDPHRIPRQLVRNWDVETFAARLESFWT